MNAERLLAHYERIADAPDAVGRLRRFILDLAVRGKLVAQESGDKPPSGFNSPSDPEAPYVLPGNWRWARIGDQLDLLNGMAFKPTDWIGSGLRIVRIQNLNNPAAPFNYCDPAIAKERNLIDDGAFLISWSGTPGTSFGAFIWKRGQAVLNQHIFRCDFKTKAFTAEYLRLAINGRLDEMIEQAHGGAGLQHITKGKLEAMLIALPPLAEQHRIVTKVDELMALCDRLEASRAEREATRDRLATSSLARLNAPDPQTFQGDARFVLNALSAVTTRSDQIKKLRQTILCLAVRGKLVPQDPEDEPAWKLLARFSIVNDAAVHNKAAKKKGDLDQIGPAGVQKLPATWCWAMTEEICEVIVDCPHSTPVFVSNGIVCLDTNSIKEGGLVAHKLRYVSQDTYAERVRRLIPRAGDLVFAREGSVGASFIVPDGMKCCLGQRVMLFRPKAEVFSRYFSMSLSEPSSLARLLELHKGIGARHVNVADMRKALIPLPPAAEQMRIVAKVDELMDLCDQLESSLADTTGTRSRLLDALLAEALSSDEANVLEAVA